MSEFYITPNARIYQHIKGIAPNLNFSITIHCDTNWSLFNDPSFVFTINSESRSEINGFGNQSVDIGMSNYINSLDNGFYTFNIRGVSQDRESLLPVYVIITENPEDFFYPNKLKFEAIKNVQESEPQKIFMTDPNVTQIQLPQWLVMFDQEPLGNGYSFRVQPQPTNMLDENYYYGEIKIHFGNIIKIVFVEYFIRSGYDGLYSKNVHFTRDNDEFVFYKSVNETTFLRLNADIKLFDYSGGVKRNFLLDLDVPFGVSDHKAKINLGQVFEPYFKLFERVLPLNARVNSAYPPMEVSIVANEIKYSDFSVVNQDLIPVQRYLRGRNPIGQIAAPFWLAFRPNRLRYVTSNATIMLQVFKPSAHAIKQIKVLLNDVHIRSIDPSPTGHNIVNSFFLFSAFKVSSISGLVPGDRITFEYEGISQKREFVVKPPQPYSYKIAFRTIWDTMDIIEFTGPASFNIEATHETSRTERNFIEVVKKLKTNTSQKVVINSGWIDSDESYLIYELIQSTKAFLINDEITETSRVGYISEAYGNIELIPIAPKLNNHESGENRISFDVEFEINKRYEDEIYSR